jgi:tripartite-type tricarboxylate transporter receptor subunit TctC
MALARVSRDGQDAAGTPARTGKSPETGTTMVHRLLAALLCAVLLPGIAHAEWPERPIRMIVPFPPGGGTDALARVLAQHLQAALGQPVAVENRAGASGVIGTEAGARAAPDGYTLTLNASGPLTIVPQMLPNPPYDPLRSVVAVAIPSVTPLLMVVPAASPLRDVQGFVAWALANPGRGNYCSIGIGSPSHLSAAMFMQRFGLDLTHVPYNGSGPALTATIGNTCDVLFDSGTSSSPLVRSGQLRALGITAGRRHPSFPDVAPISDQGAPGYETFTWSGLFAPAGTPAPIVERLNHEARALAQTPAERARIESQGGLPVDFSPAEFSDFLKREIESWGVVIRAANIGLNQ